MIMIGRIITRIYVFSVLTLAMFMVVGLFIDIVKGAPLRVQYLRDM